jgi:hypothetical protein
MKIKIIPPQTRTIFVESYCSKDLANKFNGKQETDGCYIFKFKLNIPKMILAKNSIGIKFYPINEKEQTCYSPLLNTSTDGYICIDHYTFDDFNHLLKRIYNTYFNFERYSSLQTYVEITDTIEPVLNFYQNWQNTGKLELIPV